MNERIRELAKHAETYADYYAMLADTGEREIFAEKFAELIIIDVASKLEPLLATEILKLFGVQEKMQEYKVICDRTNNP